jgi:hypothetical protein
MKWMMLVGLLALLPAGAMAQGNYSGIWRASIDPGAFVSLNQNGGTLVIAMLDSTGEWDAYIGTLSGTTATVNTVIGRVTIGMTVRFLSGSQAIVKLNSCIPNEYYACAFPVGAEIAYTKIF